MGRSSRSETLALDIGSTGVRAARYGPDGLRCGPISEQRYRSKEATAGRVDLAGLLESVVRAIGEQDLSRVGAVSMSVLWHSAVALDDEGQPLGDAVTWEARLPDWVRHRVEVASPAWSHSASGAYLHSSYGVAALPFLFDPNVVRFSDIGSWIAEQLSGHRLGWSEVMAAASGLWLQEQRAWNRPLFEALGLPDRLVPEMWSEPVAGKGNLVPELAGAMWLPVAGDGLCHNLGHGAIGPESIAVNVGTSGGIRAVLTDLTSDVDAPGLWHYRCAEDLHAVGGAVSSAGNTVEWVGRFTGERIDWNRYMGTPLNPSVRADASVYGRRGPDYPWDATGSITGLRPDSSLDDIRDAFALDLWRPFRALLDSLRPLLHTEPTIRASGGVVQGNRGAIQLLADSLGVPVQRLDVPDPSLAGAGILGAHFLRDGLFAPAAAAEAARVEQLGNRTVTETIDPRREWTDILTDRWAQEPWESASSR
ncbi:FGGY-family carbohydrate kinase [Natronoglycomyces albus]|uniref:Carbohydrate kinase n=1 Tax=Natronoglycomyces albus TaxID=2811108 RepID=A0A895XQT0_9ACTN|nr:FGGY-family carbohydrate kinase [Natronoglycomyces albus]QSB05729.1 hypothetical protein JQS30_02025 [Natronoglycomyces albus]